MTNSCHTANLFLFHPPHLATKGRDRRMWGKCWSHLNALCVYLRKMFISYELATTLWRKVVYCANECDTRQQSRRQSNREEDEDRRKGGRERVGLVLRWLVWWVGDRESWSIAYRLPIASVRGVVGNGGRVRERIGRESVLAWLLKILYTADDK